MARIVCHSGTKFSCLSCQFSTVGLRKTGFLYPGQPPPPRVEGRVLMLISAKGGRWVGGGRHCEISTNQWPYRQEHTHRRGGREGDLIRKSRHCTVPPSLCLFLTDRIGTDLLNNVFGQLRNVIFKPGTYPIHPVRNILKNIYIGRLFRESILSHNKHYGRWKLN